MSIPISVLFTAAATLEDLDKVPASEAARHRVVVGQDGVVLKDNTGFCRDDEGRFRAPINATRGGA